jgi:glutathione peroxidase
LCKGHLFKINIFTNDTFLDAHPLYKYLKLKMDGNNDTPIKWNFAKFLVDRNGIPIKKYPSAIDPKAIEEDIKKLL